MKTLLGIFLGTLILASGSLQAQTSEISRYSFDAGAGFTTPLGNTGSNLDYGWGVRGGAGINLNSHVSVMLNADYNSMGVNATTLGTIGVNGGNVNIFSARVDPVFHVGTFRKMDFYVTAGGGMYHVDETFNASGTTTTLPYSSFFQTSPISNVAGLVSNSYTINKPGVDGGIGVAMGNKWHGKFFAEARYNRVFTTADRHFDYMPVTFGFRW